MTKYAMISRMDCGFCLAAEKLFKKFGVSYEEIKVGRGITREEVKAQFPNARTYPIITVDRKYIGGYTQLKQHLAREFYGADLFKRSDLEEDKE